jgi:hypothetical protein
MGNFHFDSDHQLLLSSANSRLLLRNKIDHSNFLTYQAIDTAFVITELAAFALIRQIPNSNARLMAILAGGQISTVRRIR